MDLSLEHFDLAPPLVRDRQLKYFINSAQNLLRELRYVESEVWLNENSKRVLNEIFNLISEIKMLGEHFCAQDFTSFFNLSNQIFAWAQEHDDPGEVESSVLIDLLRKSWKRGFLDSYVTNVNGIVRYEYLRFETELLEKVNRLIQLLEEFDQQGLKGNKKPFRVRSKAEKVTTDAKQGGATRKDSEGEPSEGGKLSQPPMDARILGDVPQGALREDHPADAESKIDTLRQTEEMQHKAEGEIGPSTCILNEANLQAVKVYSRLSEESEQLVYTQHVHDSFRVRAKDYKLLEKLFSANPGAIPFEDLNRLIERCGGIVEQARGSHVKITMPGKSFFQPIDLTVQVVVKK